MRIKELNSPQNPWFKDVKNLIEKNRFRKKQGRFAVEGFKEIALALQAGFRMNSLAFVPGNVNPELDFKDFNLGIDIDLIALTPALMSEICVRSDSKTALAIFDYKEVTPKSGIEMLSVIIVEKVEKPGNLGAILRTADAAGIHEVWLCDANVDVFHPQVIRNSLGTVFHVPVRSLSFEACIAEIEKYQLQVFTTFMEDSITLFEANFSLPMALVLGTEHEGVSDRWRNIGQNVQIPMNGAIDSLNVSVAASVFMYEILRQRRIK